MVTHTFPNSFYARLSDDELLFVSNRSIRSPITINVETSANLQEQVEPEEQISIDGNEISLGERTQIHLADATVYTTSINLTEGSKRFGEIGEALHAITAILRVIDTKGSVLDDGGLTHNTVKDFVLKSTSALRSSDMAGFRRAAETLVGLGSGFTPSGDDMLGGFLAAHNSFAKDAGRQPILLDIGLLEGRTSWISAKLLDYMQRTILDEQLALVMGSAASGNSDRLISAVQSLMARGHASGIDIAVGMALGLSIVQDLRLNTTGSEGVARNLGLML